MLKRWDDRQWNREMKLFRHKRKEVIKRMSEAEQIPSWNPEKGEEIEGFLIWKGKNQTKHGERLTYLIRKVETDEVVKIWGSYKLNTYLVGKPMGTRVEIKFLGRIQTKRGRMMKDFRIRTHKPELG